MIPHVVKGGDMRGLVGYLMSTESRTDPRANQHEHPRVIGGDAFLSTIYGGAGLDSDPVVRAAQAQQISDYLDAPRRSYQVQIRTRAYHQDEATGARQVATLDDGGDRWRDEHVWHCSLSLADGENLTDDQWCQVAQEFADGMDLTEASGKAPARWVAIHHGAGKGGHDHLHIATSAVREDGTRVSFYRDFPRAQAVCRDLEKRHGLVEVDGRQHGTATRGYTAVEASTGRIGDREALALRVRAAAVASSSEAEWIRRVRAEGLVIKPRFAAGTTDVAVGYRVALKRDTRAAGMRFYSGSALGADLSLPRVRENWPEPTLEQAGEAAAEWQAAFRGQGKVVRDGIDSKSVGRTSKAPEIAAERLQAFTHRLGVTPYTDRVAWSDAARDLSGALSAWARFDPDNASQLRQSATVLARSAQDRRRGGQLGRRVDASAMGTALLFMAAKSDARPKIAAAVMLTEILNAAAAIRDYHRATGALRQAQVIDAEVIRRLSTLPFRGYEPDWRTIPEADRQAYVARHLVDQSFGGPAKVTDRTPNPLDARPHNGARTNPRGRDDGRER